MLAAVVLVAAGVRLATLDAPLGRTSEGTSALYGLLSRNYQKTPLDHANGVPVLGHVAPDASPTSAAPPTLYHHHPPLVPLLVAAVHALAGHDPTGPPAAECHVRLPAALFTLGCLPLLYRSAARRPRAGVLAAAVFVALPITMVFGGMADVVGAQLVFFVLLSTLAYRRLWRAPTVGNLALLCLAFAPAAWTDWPAFYLCPVLAAHWALTRPARTWGWFAAFGGFACLAFALAYAQIALAAGDWGWMAALFLRRAAGEVADSGEPLTLASWLRAALWEHGVTYHTPIVFALLTAWLAGFAWRRRERRGQVAAVVLAGWAALHVAVGRQGVFVHEWWWWPVAPAAALAAGLVLDRLPRRRTVDGALAAGVVLLGVYSGVRFLPELRENKPAAYALPEIGAAVRAAAEPGEAVMVADEATAIGLWYYADRPLKIRVWTPADAAARRADGAVDLPFGLTQAWPAPARVAVVPVAYLDSPAVAALAAELSETHDRRTIGKFLVFRERQAQTAEESAAGR